MSDLVTKYRNQMRDYPEVEKDKFNDLANFLENQG